MGYFPFFMDLTGKKCIVIGAGKVAQRKAQGIRSFDGVVTIYDKGEWNYPMLKDAFLVIAATDDRRINHEIASFCKEHEIMVNTADSKEDSTFLFPSLIREGPISIGISTQGNSPLIASEIRRAILSILPEQLDQITDFMGEIREEIKGLPVDSKKKRYIFEQIYEEAKIKQGKLKKEEVASVISQALNEQNDNISKK